MRKRNLGIGLLELMLSLSIIAILLVMATRYYQVTSAAQKYNEGVQEIMQIQTVVYDWKGARVDYTGLNTKDIADSGLIPEQYTQNIDSISHPWDKNGTIEIASPNSDIAQITVNNIPSGPCIQLKNRFAGAPNIVDHPECMGSGKNRTLIIKFK